MGRTLSLSRSVGIYIEGAGWMDDPPPTPPQDDEELQ